MSEYTDIRYDVDGGVAIITLNRPDRLNAWTPAMGEDVQRAVLASTERADVRAIVVTGAGRGFCAGADMGMLQKIQSGGAAARRSEPANDAPRLPPYGPDVADCYNGRLAYLLRCPKPIIAAINGPIAGLGLVFALFADVRYAARGVKFTTAFAQRGLIAEHGISWLLPRLVGHANALDLLLSSRKFDADEAGAMGLVNRVVEGAQLMHATLEYARALATTVSPRSMAIIKSQVYASLMQNFDQALAIADAQMVSSFDTPDFAEGVAHFVEKRPARFPPL